MIAFEDKMRAGGAAAIGHIAEFFMGIDPVHRTVRAIAERFDELGVLYAVAGSLGMACHGYEQSTDRVEVIVTREGGRVAKGCLTGSGYVPLFSGSRSLRDTQTGVRIEFLITGEFPGDGKPKPIAFPDPANVAVEINGIRYLKLENLIQLKLASGVTNPNRLKDLADVQELIKVLKPGRELGDRLHEFVRGKFFELWDGLQNEPAEE